jgi:hypothetical protein
VLAGNEAGDWYAGKSLEMADAAENCRFPAKSVTRFMPNARRATLKERLEGI